MEFRYVIIFIYIIFVLVMKSENLTYNLLAHMNDIQTPNSKGPLDVVKHNLYYTGYPKDKFHFIKGKVEDSLRNETIVLPDKIAILRIDTDWYESTKVELDVLWHRVQSGGVLIVDDYYAWQGARTAVDEFFRDKLDLDATRIGGTIFAYWKP